MNIETRTLMPVSSVGRNDNEYQPYIDRLGSLSTSVKNTTETVSRLTPLMTSAASSASKLCEAVGLFSLVRGLTWAGNMASYIPQLGRHVNEAVQIGNIGVKIMQHGISTLLSELLSLMKSQAFPIMNCWVSKVIDAGENVTMGEAFKLLMSCIMDDKEIGQLFKDILASP